jgi:hypothetical protein
MRRDELQSKAAVRAFVTFRSATWRRLVSHGWRTVWLEDNTATMERHDPLEETK